MKVFRICCISMEYVWDISPYNELYVYYIARVDVGIFSTDLMIYEQYVHNVFYNMQTNTLICRKIPQIPIEQNEKEKIPKESGKFRIS